jgi:hypothetical protein
MTFINAEQTSFEICGIGADIIKVKEDNGNYAIYAKFTNMDNGEHMGYMFKALVDGEFYEVEGKGFFDKEQEEYTLYGAFDEEAEYMLKEIVG